MLSQNVHLYIVNKTKNQKKLMYTFGNAENCQYTV